MKEFEIEGYYIRITQNKDLVRCVIARDKEITDIVDTFMLPNAKVEDEDIKEKIQLYINEAL